VLRSAIPLLLVFFCGRDGSSQEEPDRSARGRLDPQWIQAERAPKGYFNDVHFLDEKQGWVAGAAGRIWTTSDGGRAWTEVEGDGKEEYWRGVRFLDARRGFVVGGLYGPCDGGFPPKVAATDDGGRTWTDLTPGLLGKNPRGAFDRIQFFSPTEGLLFGEQLFATHDAGKTWSAVKWENGEISGLQCTFATAKLGWFLHDRDLWKTEDGGRTWRLTSAQDALSEDERVHGALGLVHFRNENHGCVITCWGNVLRTEDGGLSWMVLGRIKHASVHDVVLTDSTQGWAIARESTEGGCWLVLRTIDGGRTWQESYRSVKPLNRLHFIRRDVGWVVGQDTVVRFTADR